MTEIQNDVASTRGLFGRRLARRGAAIPPIPAPHPRLAPRPRLGAGRGAGPGDLAETLAAGMVLGIDCRNGHFNDPDLRYCASCGISLVHAAHVVRPGPRPPLGVLVLDDGRMWTLDRDLLIGSAEVAAEGAPAGERVLRLADQEGMVVPEHARIQLRGWHVEVVDLGSEEGTHVADPGDETWRRIPPHEPTALRAGTHVLVGWRHLRYESYRTP